MRRVLPRSLPYVARRFRTMWATATTLSAALILLALSIGAQKPASASLGSITPPQPDPSPISSEAQQNPRITQDWHTVSLPLIVRQISPIPPLYHLTIDPIDLTWLHDNWWTYDTVPAVFTYRNNSYDVQVRFRGGTVRNLPKKSWKIDFPAATPFQGQRELNLNAEYTDKTLLREMLAYDLFERVGLPASHANFARLEINGQYRGLYVQVTQVDQRFLNHTGWDPNGNLYKGNYGNFEPSTDYAAYQRSYAKKSNREDSHNDIVAFVEMINYTPEAEFSTAIAKVMDVGTYLDWVAVQVVLGNFEWLEKNYYIYHHLIDDWWAFLPWDMDLLLGHNWSWEHNIMDPDSSWDNPIDSGTWWSKKADGKWNKLVTEVLRNDEFKFAYCRRLWELMNDEFAQETMFQRIDSLYNLILPYAEADPYKWGSDEDFHNGPDELKTYVTQRLAWLTDQIPDYCPDNGPIPLINELMTDNSATLVDEADEHEPWIELFNPSLVSFDVSGMILQALAKGTTSYIEWIIPEGTAIPPGGFLLIWADGESQEGPLHADFHLNPDGGTIALYDKVVHGGSLIDQKEYGPLAPDLSFGRIRDGDATWITFDPATPGWSNLGHAPLITATTQTPIEPDDGQPVTVTTVVMDETAGPSISLHWSADGDSQISPMYDDGSHGDSVTGDRRYSAIIPSLSNGTVVTYYVQAEDTVGLVSTDPPRAPAATYSYLVGFHRPSLFLNELVAINQNVLDDEAGESDDWFEIHNAGPVAIDLGGMYLTDAIENSTKWQIPYNVTAPPGGYVVFWADNQPEQGTTHVSFKLDGDGERLALYAGPDGYNGLIDQVYYGPQAVDQSWGRYPDAENNWRTLVPTPGRANQQPPPTISHLKHIPVAPLPSQPAIVNVKVQDDGVVLTVTLFYSVGAGFQPTPMQFIGGTYYSAEIPGQGEGTTVAYFVVAVDDLGGTTVYPDDAPTITYGYHVGHTPPHLFINEFLASNDTINQDEMGEYEDWVELYNAGEAPLDISGMYVTDDLSQPTKWQVPEGTTIPAGEFLLIWTDDDEGDGPLHTSFKLDKEGEEIGLFDRDEAANALIDCVFFGPQITDVSTGRLPDGGEDWTLFNLPTPGESNTPF